MDFLFGVPCVCGAKGRPGNITLLLKYNKNGSRVWWLFAELVAIVWRWMSYCSRCGYQTHPLVLAY